MKTTKEAVIKATSDLADEKGLNNVSLKAVAQKLNIRTPSLYNHIESLDNLLLEVAHNGMRDMNERMMKIAVGKIGKEAIKLVSMQNFMRTYQRDFSRRNVFKCLQIATTKNRLN